MKNTLIERIIKNEILTLANELAEYHLYNDEHDWDNVQNAYTEFESLGRCIRGDVLQCSNCKNMGSTNEDEICINCFDPEPKEIFQWFIVSEWLFNKLNEQGEPVIEIKGLYFWGRCGCGYSLEDETSLKNIVKQLEQPLKNIA